MAAIRVYLSIRYALRCAIFIINYSKMIKGIHYNFKIEDRKETYHAGQQQPRLTGYAFSLYPSHIKKILLRG